MNDFIGVPVEWLGACAECGNDDPCEGYTLCSDCLEDSDGWK